MYKLCEQCTQCKQCKQCVTLTGRGVGGVCACGCYIVVNNGLHFVQGDNLTSYTCLASVNLIRQVWKFFFRISFSKLIESRGLTN